MALTDHDTLDGWPEFRRSCADASIQAISGVELSAAAETTVHILGYRLERPEAMERALEWVMKKRGERNERVASLLAAAGTGVTMEDVTREAKGRVVARPHFARALVAKGCAPDVQSAFSMYLAKGAPAYSPREALSPEECVGLVRDAGGLPVLAHPSLTRLGDAELEKFLGKLKESGLWGLECISSHCSSEDAFKFLRMAGRLSLYPTAGSDFHGSIRPGASLGVMVEDDFLPWARLGVSL
jgi:predicted metal-dependent phosphoesterase TrpH